MNKQKAKELLPIIKAFSEGKVIEFSRLNLEDWNVCENPEFMDYNKYRIKPQPKLVPFTFEDNLLFRDKWIYSKINEFPGVLRILSYNNSNVHIEFRAIGYLSLLRDCEFEDGSPCGKYINE